MQTHSLSHFPTTRWVYLFIILHLCCWTLVPAIVRENLPLDAIEGSIWGHQLEWGYDKNPFLNGWLTALATYLGGHSGWMIYLFSQISVALCLWGVWKLASAILPSIYALISVLMLEGMQYFNFHAIDFNDNTLELGLWTLTIYYFYCAVSPSHHFQNRDKKQNKQSSIRQHNYAIWMLTGFFAGFGLMAKYYTLALLTSMLLFLIIYPTHRRHLKTWGPYLALIVCLFISMPHIVWLFSHHWVTVMYVFERTHAIPHWYNHLYFPAQFTWQQIEVLMPASLLFSILLIGKPNLVNGKLLWPQISSAFFSISQFDKRFLFFMGIGPLLLTILLSIIFGIKLRAGWGMPLLSLWGILVVAWVKPYLTLEKINRFIGATFILTLVLLTGYVYSLINSPDTSSANFPGRHIASVITKTWHNEYHTKLAYVAGSRWVGGNISFYSEDQPATYIEWNKKFAPWIDLTQLKKSGAVFVWNISDNERLPENIKAQFPQLLENQVLEFNWKRNRKNLPPIKLGIAFLPPT